MPHKPKPVKPKPKPRPGRPVYTTMPVVKEHYAS